MPPRPVCLAAQLNPPVKWGVWAAFSENASLDDASS
jgi:hypothetical protein